MLKKYYIYISIIYTNKNVHYDSIPKMINCVCFYDKYYILWCVRFSVKIVEKNIFNK